MMNRQSFFFLKFRRSAYLLESKMPAISDKCVAVPLSLNDATLAVKRKGEMRMNTS